MFFKGNARNEKFLLILSSVIFITFLNVCLKDINLWSLSLIPVIALIHNYPNWKTAIYSILAVFITEVGTSLITKGFSNELMVNFLVNASIIVVFTLSNVKKSDSIITDPLTGAYNRKFYNQFLKDNRNLTNLSVNLLDIDYFKKINDNYGHLCGDYVLSEMVKVIQKNVRKSDRIVRLGGEEFAILSTNTEEDEGQQIAKRICECIKNTNFNFENKTIPVTVSIGYTHVNNYKSVNWFKKADEALYMAKQNGRNQVVSLA